jgi:Kelch motif protein/galactose oxidase-like protein
MKTRPGTDVRLDPTIAAWLALGPLELSDRVVDRTRGEIQRTRQRRTWRPVWRGLQKPRIRLAMAFAAGALSVVLIGVGLRLAADPLIGTSPSTSPTTTPTPSRSPLPARSPIPTESIEGAFGRFFSGATMNGPRQRHTATLLADGRVLIAGGVRQVEGGNPTERNATGPIDAVELYDPSTGTFVPTGAMTVPRVDHTATLLADGRVLLTGGSTWLLRGQGMPTALASAELYDPAAGTFAATGSMTTARSEATATLLQDGRVLIAGGSNSTTGDGDASGEIYDPTTGHFSQTPSLQISNGYRSLLSTVLLTDGRLLLVGNLKDELTISIETYDPLSGTLTMPQTLTMPSFETATVLTDGRVLLIGGKDHSDTFLSQLDLLAALFDPATGTLRDITPPAVDFRAYTGTRLADGRVLLLGIAGRADAVPQLGYAEVFDPEAETFHSFGPLVARPARPGGTATLLLDGSVLIAGGGPNLGGEPAYDGTELFK